MTLETIEEKLSARFAAPLPEPAVRRIIFWQDPAGEFESLVDALSLPGVKLLKLTGSNAFSVKKCLSKDDLESDYLVYDPLPLGPIADDWLLDIRLYSETFRADLVSMRMDELDIPQTAALRQCVQARHRFFDSKERVARLRSYGTAYQTAEELEQDILAVLTQARNNTPAAILRSLLLAGLRTEENAALQNIRKFGDEETLWAFIHRHTGFLHSGQTPQTASQSTAQAALSQGVSRTPMGKPPQVAPGLSESGDPATNPPQTASRDESLLPLAAHLLLSAMSMHVRAEDMGRLEGSLSRVHQRFCYGMVDEWMHSEDDDALYDIARQVEEEMDLPAFFDEMPMESLLGATGFPCIHECVLRRFFAQINDQVIQPEEILRAVEKRRGMKWYKRVADYYEGILQVARMQQFYQAHAAGFSYARYEKLWKDYQEDLYQMDTCYRRFHLAFSRSLRHSNTNLEDLYKGTAEYVEGLYKNWFLDPLNKKWSLLIGEEMGRAGELGGVSAQNRFFPEVVVPAMAGGRVFVIISDALRYETAAELTERLNRQNRGNARLSARQASFPTVTPVGMAALLPHRNLELQEDGRVWCDGRDTGGTENRQAVLCGAEPSAVALTFEKLLAMKRDARREAIGKAKVVYLYHNHIDAEGDKPLTEGQVSAACEEAIAELGNLVHIIVSELNGSQIYITADHGFLYTYQPLREMEKAELPAYVEDRVVQRQHRYALLRPAEPHGAGGEAGGTGHGIAAHDGETAWAAAPGAGAAWGTAKPGGGSTWASATHDAGTAWAAASGAGSAYAPAQDAASANRVADGGLPPAALGGLLPVSMAPLHSPLTGLTPAGCARLKSPGGGLNYVHGGLSLQEMMVPVIEYRNLRATSRDYVEVRKATLTLLSQSRRISNNLFSLDFFQKEPVSGKVLPAVYAITLRDEQGQAVSDTKEVLADRTDAEDQARVFRVPFTMKNMTFDRKKVYELTIVDKESGKVLERTAFQVNIAYTTDFDL